MGQHPEGIKAETPKFDGVFRHEPDPNYPQHETAFTCRWCRRRIELEDFEPGGKHFLQPRMCPARNQEVRRG